MGRDKMFTGPPDDSGTPMERFERVLRRIVSASKEDVDKRMKAEEKKKQKKRRASS